MDVIETPGIWVTTVDHANRHPGELRAHVDSGGVVKIIDTSEARIRVYWLVGDDDRPPWAGITLPDDREAVEAALHEGRSAARRQAWARREEVA